MSTIAAQVGIFWHIRDAGAASQWLIDSVPLSEAEPYGDFLNHGGHYEFWLKVAKMNAVELRRRDYPSIARWSEYEEWPRGRVVFHVPSSRFTVYADRKLQTPLIVKSLLERFGLPAEQADIRSDPHYISVR